MRRRLIIVGAIILIIAGIGGYAACRYRQQQALATQQRLTLGTQIFAAGTDRAPACALCHSLGDVVLVGPSLNHIASTAETRIAGMSAQEYIRASIVTPSAYKVQGFETGTMYPNYALDLSSDQLEAVVAFLLTRR